MVLFQFLLNVLTITASTFLSWIRCIMCAVIFLWSRRVFGRHRVRDVRVLQRRLGDALPRVVETSIKWTRSRMGHSRPKSWTISRTQTAIQSKIKLLLFPLFFYFLRYLCLPQSTEHLLPDEMMFVNLLMIALHSFYSLVHFWSQFLHRNFSNPRMLAKPTQLNISK